MKKKSFYAISDIKIWLGKMAGCLIQFTFMMLYVVMPASAAAIPDSGQEIQQQSSQERVTLAGKVTDTEGAPLPGVTVFLGGSNIGTSTDIYGNYSLSLIKGDPIPITYSFVGMKKIIYMFNRDQNTVHNVVMEPDNVALNDVVVIGYGSKSKRNVTSSVSSIKSDDLARFANGATTFDNMLGGAIKGVLVTQNSGAPGSNSTINVRGITSPISGSTNEPLYVIDGVPFFANRDQDMINPLSALSPNDIESIDVLKDAAATAIYGSRGANGVIIVNTRRGRRNEKVHITASYTLSIGNPVKRYTPLNTTEYKEVQDLIVRNTVTGMQTGNLPLNDYAYVAGLGDEMLTGSPNLGLQWSFDEYFNPISVKYTGLNEDMFGTVSTNWVEETRNKNAITHQYSIGMRGGNETTNYSLTLNATNQQGLFINEKLKHYNARLSADSDISKHFRAGAALNYSFTTRRLGSDYSFMASTKEWIARPDVPVYDANGEYAWMDGTLLYGTPSRLPNPVASRQRDNRVKSSQFIGNGYLEIKVVEGLKLRGDINISYFQDHTNMFSPTYALEDFVTFYGEYMQARLDDNHSEVANTSVNLRADYQLNIGEHNLNFMLGYGWDRTFYTGSSNSYSDFPDNHILTNISSALQTIAYAGNGYQTGLNSVYARASYNYQDKYLAEVNFRSDASSKFGPGNKRGYFPALSLGWRMSNEEFMSCITQINDLKLRFSIGQTGSTNIDNFLYKQFFGRNNTDLYHGLIAVVPMATFPNPNIKWEMTTEYNGGIDFSFFNNRLFGSIDAYYRYTNGALSPSPVSLETGTQIFYSNLLDLSNRGVEIEIGGDIIRNASITWTSKFNIALNRNKIDKLNGATINPYMSDAFTEGYPAGTLKGYVVEKIFQSQWEVDHMNQLAQQAGAAQYQEPTTGPGDYKFKDVNHDGYISTDDKVVLATPEPKFFGGFFNSVSYKNLNLSFVFQFSKGAKAAWENLQTDAGGALGQSINREMYNKTWTPFMPDAKYARLVCYDPNRNSRTSDKYVFETSYLRLKNISLSYSLPLTLLSRINVQAVQVFISASNLWTITKWPGLDPELVESGVTLNTTNRDPYPLSKIVSLGIKIDF